MTIIEALKFCKATGRSVCRTGSKFVKWDPSSAYSFTVEELLAEDWEDAKTYIPRGVSVGTSGGPSLDRVGMSPQELKALREAAKAVLSDRWELQTSNSFRRIGTVRGDGNVLHGTTQHYDGYPDLQAAPGVLDYIIAAQPSHVLALIENFDVVTSRFQRALDLVEVCLERQGTFIEECSALTDEYSRPARSHDDEDPFAGWRSALGLLHEQFGDIQRGL